MDKHEDKLYELLRPYEPETVLEEILAILKLMFPDIQARDLDFCTRMYQDVTNLFLGRYPGYRASNTAYHDLSHTVAVALAVMRMAHGAQLAGEVFSSHNTIVALAATLFHDAGLIQTEDETEGTGAQFMKVHEQRSIELMSGYLRDNGFSEQDVDDGAAMIECTILSKHIAEIEFRTQEIEHLGKFLGASDLLAQMADERYIEKLHNLFDEFEEAGIDHYDSPLTLFEKTEAFYENVVRTRIALEMDGVSQHMHKHFAQRWKLDTDPYVESMLRNVGALKMILEKGRAHLTHRP